MIYTITTTNTAGTECNYRNISTNWRFVGFTHVNGETLEQWTCETSSPAALEMLLDTDPQVVAFSSDEEVA